jgi:hypothetical protein
MNLNLTTAVILLVLSVAVPFIVYILTSTPELKEVEMKDVKAAKPSAKKPVAKKSAVKAVKAKEAVKQYKATGKTTNSIGKPVELAVVKNKLKLVESAPAVKPEVKKATVEVKAPAAKPEVKKTATAPAAKPEVTAPAAKAKTTPAAKPAVKAPAVEVKPTPAAKPEVKAEEKVTVFDKVVAETLGNPTEPKAAESIPAAKAEEKKAE